MSEKKSSAKTTQIKVTQTGSPIGRDPSQRKTLIGLGLNKMHRVKLLENTDSVMGMVRKVKHLVQFEIV